LLSGGNTNDISLAAALVDAAGPARRLIADRGYDANHLRRLLAERGIEAVIPSTITRRQPIPYDAEAYRDRNLVERMWCRLKDWRRVATRYDKLAQNYLAGAFIAATVSYWLK
jgi:transposase